MKILPAHPLMLSEDLPRTLCHATPAYSCCWIPREHTYCSCVLAYVACHNYSTVLSGVDKYMYIPCIRCLDAQTCSHAVIDPLPRRSHRTRRHHSQRRRCRPRCLTTTSWALSPRQSTTFLWGSSKPLLRTSTSPHRNMRQRMVSKAPRVIVFPPCDSLYYYRVWVGPCSLY